MTLRPDILNPFFASVQSLPGVGPKTAKLITGLIGPTVRELVFYEPADFFERRHVTRFADAQENQRVTLTGHVKARQISGQKGRPSRVILSERADGGGEELDVVFFSNSADWLAQNFPEDGEVAISGRIALFRNRRQITHPDYILPPARIDEIPRIEPVYGLTAGLTTKTLRKAITAALDSLKAVPEWQQSSYTPGKGWPGLIPALQAIHNGQVPEPARAASHARLAFDELCARQLTLLRRRAAHRKTAAPAWNRPGERVVSALQSLPFDLTGSQNIALADIAADTTSGERMNRLVQGDVGSGKTVVAALAMVHAAENGKQSALLAPTEVLAQQHHDTLMPMFEEAGLRLGYLSGKLGRAERNEVLTGLMSGVLDAVVGTHALFQDSVAFKDLGLAVIDEQHRFGVKQRTALSDKGEACHVLLMTATPIPRTLSMTLYGDLDVTLLTDKPAGRQPVKTLVKPLDGLGDVAHAIRRAISASPPAQVFWVCPMVEESEEVDLAAAVERADSLKRFLGEDQVALVHGRLTAAEKQEAIDRFAGKRANVLVATTVIEVGVDVPNASVIVIEQAERFGLAQLHQLRGRVGRGSVQSSCILLYKPPLGKISQERMAVLRDCDDGFELAETDLRLRGAGDMLGNRQTGLPKMMIADFDNDGDLLAGAQKFAEAIVSGQIDAPENIALLEALFYKEDASGPAAG